MTKTFRSAGVSIVPSGNRSRAQNSITRARSANTHQIRSTHGSIIDPEEEHDNIRRESSIGVSNYHPSDQEPRDAIQEVISFNPWAESSTPRETHATAYATLVRPNGETITRGMSRHELMRYEQLSLSHIQGPQSLPYPISQRGFQPTIR